MLRCRMILLCCGVGDHVRSKVESCGFSAGFLCRCAVFTDRAGFDSYRDSNLYRELLTLFVSLPFSLLLNDTEGIVRNVNDTG